jgi:hypothetical protein
VSPDELVPLFIRTAPVDEAPLPKSKIAERDEEVAILTSVFDLPTFMVVAFVVPMLRVVALLSTDSNFAVEELKTDTFVVPSILVVLVKDPILTAPAVDEPRVKEPLVKLSQMLKSEVELFACILLIYAVPVTI